MNRNRHHEFNIRANSHFERDQQRVHEVRQRVLKARARNRSNPLETLQNLSILGLIVIFCAFAVGAL